MLTSSREDLDIPIGRVMGSGYDARERQGNLVGTDTPTLFEAALLSRYIPAYIDLFGSQNVHFFILERMKKDPEAELTALYRFLQVDETHVPETADERVNDALVPQSKGVARLASSTAFTLRRLGADRLLTALHDSPTIKKALFTKSDSAGVELPLDDTDRDVLREEERKIIEIVPNVEEHWKS